MAVDTRAILEVVASLRDNPQPVRVEMTGDMLRAVRAVASLGGPTLRGWGMVPVHVVDDLADGQVRFVYSSGETETIGQAWPESAAPHGLAGT